MQTSYNSPRPRRYIVWLILVLNDYCTHFFSVEGKEEVEVEEDEEEKEEEMEEEEKEVEEVLVEEDEEEEE